MRSLVRVLALASALICSVPLLAEELTVSDLKAFSARMDAAATRCDVNTILDRIAELATLSGTGYDGQGQMLQMRMNKSQYRALLTNVCEQGRDYSHQRTNEKITINGDQATITADVAETITLNGEKVATKTRERATVELFGDKLMVTQIVSNEVVD